MKIEQTNLPGVLLITPRIWCDARGHFFETWNEESFRFHNLPTDWVQDNASLSHQNVVRGIHYQLQHAQAKLIRATSGAVFDVAVDLRRSSSHFGQHAAVTLTAESGQMLLIPAGFGHGFCALTPQAGISYKVADIYDPASERTLLWNDPVLDIQWPVAAENAILSDKDRAGLTLDEAEVYP